MTPLLESFGPDEWAVIAIGCVLVILVPSLMIGGTVAAAEWLLRTVNRRRAAIPEIIAIPTVPAAASAADIDAEWADIESAIRGSK